MTITGGRAPQLADKNAYSNQTQFLDMRRQLATLQAYLRGVLGSVQAANLSTTQLQDFFDSTGKGKANLRWSGWAIANGNNGTTDLTGFAAYAGLTPLVFIATF